MSWEWEVLIALVRFLFLLAPFMSVARDFALVGNILEEAREFALAGSCRAMLVSFPPQLFFTILAKASRIQCQNVRLLTVALYVLATGLLSFALFKIPTRHFRGTIAPFVWLALFTIISVLAQVFGLEAAISLICRP